MLCVLPAVPGCSDGAAARPVRSCASASACFSHGAPKGPWALSASQAHVVFWDAFPHRGVPFPTEAAQAGPHPSQLPAGPWGCRGAVGVPVSPHGAAGGTHPKVPRKAAPGCASITPALPGGARSKPPPGTGSGTAPRPPLSAADPKPLGDLIPLRNLPFA